jgi:hypothetical protein
MEIKMETFKEFYNEKTNKETLLEMPRRKPGDWVNGVKFLGTISLTVIKKNWEYIETFEFTGLQKMEMRQLKNNLEFIVGYEAEFYDEKTKIKENRFRIIYNMVFTRKKNFEPSFKCKKLIEVNGVAIIDGFQGYGIATGIYKYFTNVLDYTILSDKEQYFGARLLWNRFSKDVSVQVDVVDVNSREIWRENVLLKHGPKDEEFNKDYWADDESKNHIRFLLRKMKVKD